MDNNNKNKKIKTSHKGRIFLMCLALPALALSTTAIIWPSVKSCSSKDGGGDTPTPTVDEVEIDPEKATETKIASKETVGETLVVTLEAVDVSKKEVQKVEVRKGNEVLQSPDDYTFNNITQQITITKQGLAKSGNVLITPTIQDRWYMTECDADIIEKKVNDDGTGTIKVKTKYDDTVLNLDEIQIYKGSVELYWVEDYQYTYDKENRTYTFTFKKSAIEKAGVLKIEASTYFDFEFEWAEQGETGSYEMTINDAGDQIYTFYPPQTEEGENQVVYSVDDVNKGGKKLGASAYSFDKSKQQLTIKKQTMIDNPGKASVTTTLKCPHLDYMLHEFHTCSVLVKAESEKLYDGAEVIIPQTVKIDGEVYVVTEVEATGFTLQTGLKSITFPETIAKIGANAFFGCTNLESAKFEQELSLWNIENQEEITKQYSVQDPMANAARLLSEEHIGKDWIRYDDGNRALYYWGKEDERGELGWIKMDGYKNLYTRKFTPSALPTDEKGNKYLKLSYRLDVNGNEDYIDITPSKEIAEKRSNSNIIYDESLPYYIINPEVLEEEKTIFLTVDINNSSIKIDESEINETILDLEFKNQGYATSDARTFKPGIEYTINCNITYNNLHTGNISINHFKLISKDSSLLPFNIVNNLIYDDKCCFVKLWEYDSETYVFESPSESNFIYSAEFLNNYCRDECYVSLTFTVDNEVEAYQVLSGPQGK